jgi:hypothetical protein
MCIFCDAFGKLPNHTTIHAYHASLCYIGLKIFFTRVHYPHLHVVMDSFTFKHIENFKHKDFVICF